MVVSKVSLGRWKVGFAWHPSHVFWQNPSSLTPHGAIGFLLISAIQGKRIHLWAPKQMANAASISTYCQHQLSMAAAFQLHYTWSFRLFLSFPSPEAQWCHRQRPPAFVREAVFHLFVWGFIFEGHFLCLILEIGMGWVVFFFFFHFRSLKVSLFLIVGCKFYIYIYISTRNFSVIVKLGLSSPRYRSRWKKVRAAAGPKVFHPPVASTGLSSWGKPRRSSLRPAVLPPGRWGRGAAGTRWSQPAALRAPPLPARPPTTRPRCRGIPLSPPQRVGLSAGKLPLGASPAFQS